jgi:protein-tyrosine phosphatase
LSGCYADVQTRMKREKLIHGMLDHADEILPGLYLGSIEAMLGFHNMPIAQRSEWRIISLLSDTDMFGVTTPLFMSKHVLFRVEDRRSQDMSGVFDKCADEITRAFARRKKVLVHCVAGISRSPSAVAAYLIKNKGMDVDAALFFIKKQRDRISPNKGFLDQLKDFHAKLQIQTA